MGSVIILIALIAIGSGTAYSSACENLSATNKSNPLWWFDKGSILFIRNDEATYDQATKLNQSYAEAWDHKGNALRKMGYYNEAIAAYGRAIGLNPKLAEPWYDEGVALFDKGRYNESIKAYEKAIELNPKWALPLYGKGKSLDQLGLHQDAVEINDKAVELDLKSAKQSK